MPISIQSDSTLPQGYILVDGQRAATISTTGLSATLADGLVTTSALASGAVTTEKIASDAVTTTAIAASAITSEKMSGGQSGSAPVYGCRAWASFNGALSAGGINASQDNQPVFIRASGNVASVIRNSSGDYTINFVTPMQDTSYCVNTSVMRTANDKAAANGITVYNNSLTVSSFRIFGWGVNASGYSAVGDSSWNFVSVFR
jgi:hypothetical protein